MTTPSRVYGEALYSLSLEEKCRDTVLSQLNVLESCFTREPEFLHLLDTPTLPKEERCRVLDNIFRGKLEPYVLNFLKILTEKGCMRHFSGCAETFRALYNQDNGILPVTAITAFPLEADQMSRLTEKLGQITGKRITLTNQIEPAVMGGIRLDWEGSSLDGTLAYQLDNLRSILKNTIL